MTDLIESGAIEEVLGDKLAEPESTRVGALIRYASSRLRRKVPHLDDRIALWATDSTATGALDPDLVKGTMVAAVMRAVEYFRVGPRVRSEQYPEVTTTYAEPSQADLLAAVYFTDEELADLLIDGGRPAPRWRFC